MKPVAIDTAILDPHLLGAGLGDTASWSTWLSVLRAAFALGMSEADRAIFAKVAGGRAPPSKRVNELWSVCGRGGGKSRTAAALAVFIAAFVQHRLAVGEVGVVMVLAASQQQASVVFGYALGFLQASPMLAREIASTTSTEIRLRNGIIISVRANSYRTVRGATLLATIFDEVSFWKDADSALPDVETYRACLPSLARTGGMLIAISTGYRRMGLLYEKWRDHFGQDGDAVLVVQGSSATFNPTLDAAVIAAAKAADPEASEAEWEGGFRSDISGFLSDEMVEAAIDHGRPLELPPRPGLHYRAFIDPSGGRHDAFTLAIGHKEGTDTFIADVVRARHPPFDPVAVVTEYAKLLKEYRIAVAHGDNYSAEWVTAAFRDAGIKYERSEQAKSVMYLEALPLFTRNAMRIPDLAKLTRELKLLERRVARSGKDSVDHGRHGSDDLANALCGAAYLCVRRSGYDLDGMVKGLEKMFGGPAADIPFCQPRPFWQHPYFWNR